MRSDIREASEELDRVVVGHGGLAGFTIILDEATQKYCTAAWGLNNENLETCLAVLLSMLEDHGARLSGPVRDLKDELDLAVRTTVRAENTREN